MGTTQDVSHTGSKAAFIKAEETPKGSGIMLQKVDAKNYVGKRVKLSGYLKTEDVKYAGLYMKVTNKKGNKGNNTNRTWRIIDLGCGGGDSLRAIAKWAEKQNLKVELTGVDLLEDAISYAKANSQGFDIDFIQSDFKEVKSEENTYHACLDSKQCK